MTPISLSCVAKFPYPPESIAEQILDLEKWSEFKGYGPLPGIKRAEFEIKTTEIVGTRIRVTNSDGSSHVEEITVWRPNERIELQFGWFSPPLSRLATHFIESLEFTTDGSITIVKRSMHLYPKSIWAAPILWMISFPLQRALSLHLNQFGHIAPLDAAQATRRPLNREQ